MGQQYGPALFSIGGAAIGAFLGGPIGQVIGGLAGGIIGSLVFRPKKPLISDVQFMNSSYGNPIPIIWGSVRLSGTVIWMDKVTIHGHAPGKGIGGGSGYSYWQDVAVGFCEGVASLVKVFLDGRLFLDNTTKNGELTKYRFALREYQGTSTQEPDFIYKLWVEINVVPPTSIPAFRDIAYLMFDKIDLAHFGGRFPQVSAIWSSNTTVQTIFAELTPWAPDVSSSVVIGATVDWQRNVAYSLAADGTIRAFDLSSHLCINARAGADLFSGFPHFATVSLGSIACSQGGDIYVASNQVLAEFGNSYLWTIDPNSLSVIQEVTLNGAFFPGGVSINVATVSSPAQSFDMIIGTHQIGGAFVVDPTQGHLNQVTFATTYAGLDVRFFVAIGNKDQINGTTDVYIANDDAFGDGQVHIWKGTIDDQNLFLFASSEFLTLSWTDFGLGAPSSGDVIDSFGYDSVDDSLLVASRGRTLKWTPGLGVVWLNTTFSAPFSADSVLDRGFSGGSGTNLDHFSGGIAVLDTSSGQVTRSPVVGTARGANFNPFFNFDSYSNALVYVDLNNQLYIAYLKRVTPGEVPIADIITDICSRVGIDSTMIDVSLLTQTVAGYGIMEEKSAGAAIADLLSTFQIDMVESDYTLKFVPRGQPSAVTLTQDKLGSVETDDSGKFWEESHTQELELPLQINVKYSDPDLDYQPGAQYARRTALPVPTAFSKRKKTIPLPIVATAIEGRQIAEKILYTMWAERDQYETVLSPEFLWLDPGDNVTVDLDNGSVYSVRMEHLEVGADLSMKPRFSSEDATTYAGSTSPGALVSFAPQTISPAPFGNILLFNVPLLQDSDDTAGTATRIYYAAGIFTGWGGGGMYNSLDFSSWSLLQTLPNAVDWGRAVTALSSTPAAFATDYTNTVSIAFSDGSTVPSSCSYTDLMNGKNAALLGSEIIQFQTVTDNGDGSFTLSVLARGRKGTEWAVGLHHSGDVLVMLETGILGSSLLPLTQIGQTEGWRLVPIGRFLDQVNSQSFAYLGYDLKPFAPVAFSRTVSGADLVLAWKHRTRFGGLMMDSIDTVPLNEASEAYEAYVLPSAAALATFDPTNAGTYTRAFLGLTAPTVTYTAAQMTTDGFVPATATLFLVVFQISAVIGRGFQGYQALPAF